MFHTVSTIEPRHEIKGGIAGAKTFWLKSAKVFVQIDTVLVNRLFKFAHANKEDADQTVQSLIRSES